MTTTLHDIHNLSDRALYAILQSHDMRFDGHVFVGVKSTGIYCRPVCYARVPKFENCTFHVHAAAAECAGFRPCLLCRPELAPGAAPVDATPRLARLALRRIEDGALNEISVDALAREFGVSGRHLRRAVHRELGVTPVQLAQTQRLLQAKQLLTETTMSITEVAFAAGFDSLRRFNGLFKSRYGIAPRGLRRRSISSAGMLPEQDVENDAQTFRIDYRAPFNGLDMSKFLGARAIPGVETIAGEAYVRTVRCGPHEGWLMVAPCRPRGAARAPSALAVTMSEMLQPVCVHVLQKVKTVFDTRADSAVIDAHLGGDKVLAKTIAKHEGMRLPGAFDGFELLLRAILGQQVSVKAATTLAGRAAVAFGTPLQTPWSALTHTSPSVDRIANARVDRIARLGIPRKRAESIRFVARAICDETLNLVPGADPERTRERLLAIPGIGDWTASYVAMRALAWPDAFPAGDLGIKKALGLTSKRAIEARTEQWRPWRAYGAIYLWLSLSGG